MPTYEYRCPDGHEFEKFVQKMSDAVSMLVCPTCGVMAARRMSAGGGLLFKGSGFYITDYGKDGKKDQRTAATAEAAKSDATAKAEGTAKSESSAKPDSAGSSAAPTSSPAPAAKPAPSATAPSAPAKDTPKSGKKPEKEK